MKNNELSKKLKEVGFPQYTFGISPINHAERYDRIGGEMVFIPTLSELIDACGDKFISLSNNRQSNPPGEGWTAIANPIPSIIEKWVEIARGTSPEDAIANLWIKLNEKEERIDEDDNSADIADEREREGERMDNHFHPSE